MLNVILKQILNGNGFAPIDVSVSKSVFRIGADGKHGGKNHLKHSIVYSCLLDIVFFFQNTSYEVTVFLDLLLTRAERP